MIDQPFHGNIKDICQLAGLTQHKTLQITTSWHSQTLNNQVQQHIKQCPFITIFDEQYPLQLREIYCPPLVLFYAGDIGLLKSTMLGVVGARKNTRYGAQSIRCILPGVIQHSITVVSGLATGIDGLSHMTALENHGRTIGVIGTGLDVSYPTQNQALQTEMARTQLVITEYPLGARPYRSHFPERNRIIAGLCETLLVVEAQEKSGSLITASICVQENRNVCAIPGRITDSMSVGCNQLIAAGAKPVLTAEDLLLEFRK
ncbi:DNA protecting protein DprA [Paucilactobacillus vaccinostercus DSM 20634]|uniref:DNA protecting protein DprA n=1 Tax=Paucilactobacillus vaccinostercus DSM 20634 TaxID=1423813 RepID=A0A0R2AHF9_9LACO|nr:DNA protecting protein DprA [Paucilactobacillus vaccinostercus DSM 20634]